VVFVVVWFLGFCVCFGFICLCLFWVYLFVFLVCVDDLYCFVFCVLFIYWCGLWDIEFIEFCFVLDWLGFGLFGVKCVVCIVWCWVFVIWFVYVVVCLDGLLHCGGFLVNCLFVILGCLFCLFVLRVGFGWFFRFDFVVFIWFYGLFLLFCFVGFRGLCLLYL